MADLHLVRLSLRVREVFALAETHNLLSWKPDDGYLAHVAIKALFQDLAPAPFAFERSGGRYMNLLAYASKGERELQEFAETYAEPRGFQTLQSIASKPMPSSFAPGRRLGFAVRVCPTLRVEGRQEFRDGAEVDAYLLQKEASREEVYRGWLDAAFKRMGGAALESSRMTGFQLSRISRRARGEGRSFLKPDATFCGVLRVEEEAKFSELLARGVGRHRAFGFGMLLLRPPPP